MDDYNEQNSVSLGIWRKDYFAGMLMLLVGAGAAYQSQSYEIGTLNNVGPGFFPSVVAWLLVTLGVAITLTARKSSGEAEKIKIPDVRGSVAILVGLIAFIILGEHGGLLPATFTLVFISALGDRENSIVGSLVLAGCMCVAAVVIFSWALKMQFPLFAWS